MSSSAQRSALIFFGLLNLGLGLIMALAPGFFFDHIGDYGSENDHYIGDVAAFYVAAGIGLLVASNRPAWRVPVCVVAALWYGFHALNHLFDIGLASSDARGWSDTILIGIGAVALALLARAADEAERQGAAGATRRSVAAPKRPGDYPPGD